MKKVDQILSDGSIVEDYDEPLRPKAIYQLFGKLFKGDLSLDGKQYVIKERLGLLVANVTYLGHPWDICKKRIQLKKYYPDYYQKNLENGMKTLFVGLYHYKDNYMFVVFNPELYVKKKSHNSSAHVQTYDLAYAAKTGRYSKTDSMHNFITVMTQQEFVAFIKQYAAMPVAVFSYDELLKQIEQYLHGFLNTIPKGTWYGIKCYEEMKAANDENYKQGEWQGWYLEYLFKKYTKDHANLGVHYRSDKTANGIDFDIVFDERDWIYGDLKSDKEKGDILGNKFASFDKVIDEHDGRVLYVVLRYKAELDKKHGYETTLFWNDHIREANKRYQDLQELQGRYGSRMKYSVTPLCLKIISIDKAAYEILKKDPFHQGRNSDGKEREPKLKINKGQIDSLCVYTEIIQN